MAKCPDCTWEEIPNKAKKDTVKAYRVVTLCAAHEAQREADEAVGVQEANDSYKEQLISAKSRDLAVDALIVDGVLDSNGDLVEGSS